MEQKKKENRKKEGGKLKMEGGNVTKRGEDFFVLFLFLFFVSDLLLLLLLFCSLFKRTEICFGSTKMEIFYRRKAFYAGKKIRKNDFAPSEKSACYVSLDY